VDGVVVSEKDKLKRDLEDRLREIEGQYADVVLSEKHMQTTVRHEGAKGGTCEK